MKIHRSLTAVVVCAASCFPVWGQDNQPAPKAETPRIASPDGKATLLFRPESIAEGARFTLWVSYRTRQGPLLDHWLYLEDLQRRFGGKGLQVAVLLPLKEAKLVAERKPQFLVAAPQANLLDLFASRDRHPHDDGHVPTTLLDGDTNVRSWSGLDGVIDVLQPFVEGEAKKAPPAEVDQMLDGMLMNVGDANVPIEQITPLVALAPRSGRMRALAVLEQWWNSGNYEGANKAIDEGFQALAGETVPLAIFADLVLRGDRIDARLAKRIAAEMGPVAAAAPDGIFTQLVYLRALLRADQDRLAGRLAARLQKDIVSAPDQLLFAETLMEGANPAVYRDLASKAITAALAAGADTRWGFAARHKVLMRCGDVEAADKLMIEYRAGDSSSAGLNNDAWYLMTRPDSMGRFDTLALAQCEEMQRLEGEALDNGNKDTVALGLFLNGKLQEAVDLQTAAAAASGDSPPYVARLNRFVAALELQRQQQATKPGR